MLTSDCEDCEYYQFPDSKYDSGVCIIEDSDIGNFDECPLEKEDNSEQV